MVELRLSFVWGLVVALFYTGATQAEVYRWLDAQGNVHFGDRAPLKNQSVERLEMKPPAAQPAPQIQDAERRLRQQVMAEQLQKARLQKAQQTAQNKAQEAKRKAQCEAARARIKDDERFSAYYVLDKAGERQFLSDEQVAAARRKQREIYQQKCGEG